jgi:hypothetical protein
MRHPSPPENLLILSILFQKKSLDAVRIEAFLMLGFQRPKWSTFMKDDV